MEREEAVRALEVLRRVVTQARDDTALQNWGLIWMVQGVLNGAGFIATYVLVSRGVQEPPYFVGLWSAVLGLGVLVVPALKKSRAGARTFVETQLWAIWMTFIAAVSVLAVLNHLMGLRTFFLGPVIGVLAAVAFASMGSLMGKQWFVASGVFVLAAFVMGLFPDHQFLVIGIVWGLAQFSAGVALDIARRRRLRTSGEGARLV